jgi:glycosyltransferase involved in cell wall biosynthesis
MRILHLLSNFRWTERTEPAVDLALAQQRLGHTVVFACGRNRGAAPEDGIEGRAARKGLTYDDRLEFTKHFRAGAALRDLPRLRGLIDEARPDVVHAHMPNAHLLAALALRAGAFRSRPVLVRSIYEAEGPEWPVRYALFCQPSTDGLLAVSESIRRRLVERGGERPERVAAILPGIDLEPFADARDLGPLDRIPPRDGEFIAGMVTAIGPRRRLDVALEAVARLAPRHPGLRLIVVGRGKPDMYVRAPAVRLGIADRVLLPGYCRHDDLVRAYRAMDAFVYPYPGTDQSCRAVREAMAAGVPVIASRVGILPELIRDGETGLLAGLSGESMAAALERLILDPERRAAMAAAAAQEARRRFCRLSQAEQVLSFYERLQNSVRTPATMPQ